MGKLSQKKGAYNEINMKEKINDNKNEEKEDKMELEEILKKKMKKTNIGKKIFIKFIKKIIQQLKI